MSEPSEDLEYFQVTKSIISFNATASLTSDVRLAELVTERSIISFEYNKL